jgi:hypothetical protein
LPWVVGTVVETLTFLTPEELTAGLVTERIPVVPSIVAREEPPAQNACDPALI